VKETGARQKLTRMTRANVAVNVQGTVTGSNGGGTIIIYALLPLFFSNLSRAHTFH